MVIVCWDHRWCDSGPPGYFARLRGTPKLAKIASTDVDAVFVVGGQGPMVTMIDDGDLHRFVADVYETGGIVAAVCHGTCILLKTRLQNGELLVHGKRWTGFADAEEDSVESAVGKRIQPFRIESEASTIPGTEFVTAGPFESFAVHDGRLITGQQQASSARAAEEVVAALG